MVIMSSLELEYGDFLALNLKKYVGEWVAVYQGKVVSHGKNVKEVAIEAQKVCGNNKFLLSRVPTEETMIF